MSDELEVDLGGGRAKKVAVNYPANSQKAKDEKRVEKVVIGEVTQRKKSMFHRIAGSMVSEDSESVTQYVLFEVLIPAAKNMISDAVSQGVERMLFGDRPRSGQSNSRPGYTSYNRVTPSRSTERRELSHPSRARHEFDDVLMTTRGEAEEVLDRLRDLIDKYEMATVADFYDLVGISNDFTDNKWGWYDMKNAGVRAVRGGYIVVLPKTLPIE